MKKTIQALLVLALLASLLLALLPAAQAVLPATGCPNSPDGRHEWYGERPVDQGAWCTLGQGVVRYCSYCYQEGFEQTSPPLGHDWGTWELVIPATCTTAGESRHKCNRCGLVEENGLPALGHDWSDWQTITAATCESEGLRARSCSRCGQRETQTIPAPGHNWSDWKVEYPGTCVQQGMNVRKCANCGKEDYIYSGYGEHDWGEWTVVTEATGSKDGLRRRVCKNDASHVEEEAIPATGEPEGPELTIVITAAPDAGEGKRVVGAIVTVEYAATNTGNCPLYINWEADCVITTKLYNISAPHGRTEVEGIAWNYGEYTGVTLLNPGETYSDTRDFTIQDYHVRDGEIIPAAFNYIWYMDEEGNYVYDTAGGEDPRIALTFPPGLHPFAVVDVWTPDSDEGALKRVEGAKVNYRFSITNCGNCPIYVPWYDDDAVDGYSIRDAVGERTEVSGISWGGGLTGVAKLEPDEAIVAKGIQAVTAGNVSSGSMIITQYCPFWYMDETNALSPAQNVSDSTTVKLTYPDEFSAKASLVFSAEEDAGEGKRVEGAIVPITWTFTNVGNQPVYIRSWEDIYSIAHDQEAPSAATHIEGEDDPVVKLEPGEQMRFIYDQEVYPAYVKDGFIDFWVFDPYFYFKEGGELGWRYTAAESILIPLTYPEETEPPRPELTMTYLYDFYEKGGFGPQIVTTDDTFDPEDWVSANHSVLNSGNVPLRVVEYYKAEGGYEDTINRWLLKPGDSDEYLVGIQHIKNRIAPGTETDDLLGVVTISFYAVGYDPDTYVDENNPGPELCRTETITRTWKVRKPGPQPWEIPEFSDLSVMQVELSSSADPAGYQLGEPVNVTVYLKNTGEVDIPGADIDVEMPYRGEHWHPEGTVAVDETREYGETLFDSGLYTVTESDVKTGYLYFPMVTVQWKDPDSEKTHPAYSSPLSLTTTSKTGLLLHKEVANKPAKGDYFTQGEEIQWSLTVTNNSKEPIRNVTVTDQGKVVGTFAEITPGKTENCAVPGHTVTEYDTDVVGYVVNQATATGEDVKGVSHTYNSNIAKAPTSESPDPWQDTGDPGKDPFDSEQDTPLLTPVQEGGHCEVILDALGDAQARYILRYCQQHEKAARAADTQDAAQLWRGEIEAIYQELLDAAADEEAKAVVEADRTAYFGYIDALTAMAPTFNIADELRIQCAYLCQITHTAPDALTDSLRGSYATLAGGNAEATGRAIGPMNGREAEMNEHFGPDTAPALEMALNTIRNAGSYAVDVAFAQAQRQWQLCLDQIMNPAYGAADRDGRKVIASWRKGVDQLYTARKALLNLLYENAPEVVEEALMNLYKNAAIDAAMAFKFR